MYGLSEKLLRHLNRWTEARLRALGGAELDPAAAIPPDYHALDRLYNLQSEERQERRGLETRAAATIAAALASVAFSANAVSSQISAAGPAAVALLSIGAGLLSLGLLATSVSLFGHSRLVNLVTRWAARAATSLPLLSPAIRISSVERRAVVDALSERRKARATGDPDAIGEANRAVNRALARLIARSLPGVSALPLDLAVLLLDRQGTEIDSGVNETAAVKARGYVSDERTSMSEPASLQEAIEGADQEAQRLRGENAATIVVLRWTSLMLGLGVVVLAAGVVVLLIESPLPVTH